MPWYKVTMTPQDVAAGRGMNLQEEFTNVFMRLGGPQEAGMFDSQDLRRNEYFFSPRAVEIAAPLIARFNGIECEAPKLSSLAILVANGGARAVPFAPEEVEPEGEE